MPVIRNYTHDQHNRQVWVACTEHCNNALRKVFKPVVRSLIVLRDAVMQATRSIMVWRWCRYLTFLTCDMTWTADWLNSSKGIPQAHALRVYTFGKIYAPCVYLAHALRVYYTFGKVYAPCVYSAHALRVYYTFGKVYAPCVYSAHALRVY